VVCLLISGVNIDIKKKKKKKLGQLKQLSHSSSFFLDTSPFCKTRIPTLSGSLKTSTLLVFFLKRKRSCQEEDNETLESFFMMKVKSLERCKHKTSPTLLSLQRPFLMEEEYSLESLPRSLKIGVVVGESPKKVEGKRR